jgi:hypothetical protein
MIFMMVRHNGTKIQTNCAILLLSCEQCIVTNYSSIHLRLKWQENFLLEESHKFNFYSLRPRGHFPGLNFVTFFVCQVSLTPLRLFLPLLPPQQSEGSKKFRHKNSLLNENKTDDCVVLMRRSFSRGFFLFFFT